MSTQPRYSLLTFDLQTFVETYVTGHSGSWFAPDLKANYHTLLNRMEGRNVLVIGGAGTIGSHFIKSLLPYSPERIYVVDISENQLTELIRDLRSTYGLRLPKTLVTYPVNYADPVFRKILQNEGPFHIVANFAAHKHVRTEKDKYAIEAMLMNNVIRAKELFDLLLVHPPERFFCVSTDKAANPVNVMGASKKLMEDLVLTYSTEIHTTTARFANVAFSNGSLLAGFLERLMKRQPLSAPLDVKRYFVSPSEAGDICLAACLLGESGDIFFPLLPENSIRTFSEIAADLLRTLGYEPLECESEEEARRLAAQWHPAENYYPVWFFRSETTGEKLQENFFTETEQVVTDRFQTLGVIRNDNRMSPADFEELFATLRHIFINPDSCKRNVINLLQKHIAAFHHVETGLNLDQKM